MSVDWFLYFGYFKRHTMYVITLQALEKNAWKFIQLSVLFQIMGYRMWCMLTSVRRP